MKALVLALAVPLLAAVPQYRIDLSRYFATPASEAASRRRTIADAHAFLRSTTSSVGTPMRLAAWLDAFNRLSEQLERHDLYVYVRAEENTEDTSDAQADDALGSLEDLTGAHAGEVIASLGRERARRFVDAYAPLARYRYFIESAIARSAHDPGFAVNRAIAQLADPTINAMGASYKVLRKKTLAEAATATHAGATAAMAKHDAFANHEESFATMLIAIASARNGTARLRGFSGAAEASYFNESLTLQSVTRTLNAVRAADSYRRYDAVVAAAPAKRFVPAAIPIEKAIPLILAAERPMGAVYASAYERLFDPAQRRLDICTDPACDGSGFSIGFAGFESGLFFGGYTGSVNSARAVAHEAGHAVHRQFMNEHQAVAVYNDGPKWMFESFAIFNELLFYD
ncbi:MAG TPA: hypothetical protein VGN11_03920, partial [Candidatus Baltobacteraceae bacterium]|nr:hypothetical protein [Candidatus Baltobacteraceae bacterium]